MAEESKSRKTTPSTRKSTASKSTSAAKKPAPRAPAKKAGTSKSSKAKAAPKRTTTKPTAKTPAKKAGTSKGPEKAPSRPPVNIAPLAAAASANPGNEEEPSANPGAEEETSANPGGDEAGWKSAAGNGTEGTEPQPSLHHGEGWQTVDISDTVAPSIGPHTTFDMPVHKGPRGHDEAHTLDAMGLDKRRPVVGGRYSPPLSKQLTIYGVALAVIAALAIGAILLVGELDKAPDDYPAKAPWSNSDKPPAQLQ